LDVDLASVMYNLDWYLKNKETYLRDSGSMALMAAMTREYGEFSEKELSELSNELRVRYYTPK
jgi:hypothetical protein